MFSASPLFFFCKIIFVADRSLFLLRAIKPCYAQKALITSLVARTIPYPWTWAHLCKLTLLSVKSLPPNESVLSFAKVVPWDFLIFTDFSVISLSVYRVYHRTAKREGCWLKEGKRMAFLNALPKLYLCSEDIPLLGTWKELHCCLYKTCSLCFTATQMNINMWHWGES